MTSLHIADPPCHYSQYQSWHSFPLEVLFWATAAYPSCHWPQCYPHCAETQGHKALLKSDPFSLLTLDCCMPVLATQSCPCPNYILTSMWDIKNPAEWNVSSASFSLMCSVSPYGCRRTRNGGGVVGSLPRILLILWIELVLSFDGRKVINIVFNYKNPGSHL